ncbi:acyltransferase family protein [Paraburkholderia phenoliruptrix]|uniref:acyltransferase family protein n=1 Tax=Paraburkholderia phenoliruptrix TaxID=252970 RepID=UPI001C6F0A6C|nr:acyltransferase [Paraburkholderia phenoliruptrix]MBW9106773.1 acyltransferase [Paraburkholderia phenoliruptrix]MBW9131838.1 acyltransferase [Paraburkholderia ginsengiterrae]
MLYSVQVLRALAAVLVVVCHAIHKQGQISGTGATWEFGGSGVDLFFIISGFIMCYVTMNRQVTARDFLKARVLRIVPLYWTLSLVALAVYLANPAIVNSSGGTTTIVNSFTLIPTGDKFLIQTGWTLSYEFLFYLVFAASLSFAMGRRLAFTCGALLVLVAGGVLLSPSNPTLKFVTSPLLLEFVMGIAAYLYVREESRLLPLSVALVAGGILALCVMPPAITADARVISYGLPFMMIFAGLVKMELLVRQACETIPGRLATAIGAASYSLYLAHPFALAAAAMIVKRSGIQHYPVLSVAILVASALVAGYACFSLIEVNLNRWIKSASRKRTARLSKTVHEAVEQPKTTRTWPQ